jgi:hypothetical protein
MMFDMAWTSWRQSTALPTSWLVFQVNQQKASQYCQRQSLLCGSVRSANLATKIVR